MSVVKLLEVLCDQCNESIGVYADCSKADARRGAKAEGARLSNDKDFCNDNCYWNYEDKQTQAHRNRGAK